MVMGELVELRRRSERTVVAVDGGLAAAEGFSRNPTAARDVGAAARRTKQLAAAWQRFGGGGWAAADVRR